jgi:hypothetical protein
MASKSSWLKRASFSLRGHIALFEAAFSLPLFTVFLWRNYSEGTLTLVWALYLVILWAVLGGIGAVIFWYGVTSPLIKTRDGSQ